MYFPLFLMQSGRKRSAHSRRQFIQCFLTGAAFRQRPLSPLTYQCSCRDKNIAPGGTDTETSCEADGDAKNLGYELFSGKFLDAKERAMPIAAPPFLRAYLKTGNMTNSEGFSA